MRDPIVDSFKDIIRKTAASELYKGIQKCMICYEIVMKILIIEYLDHMRSRDHLLYVYGCVRE